MDLDELLIENILIRRERMNRKTGEIVVPTEPASHATKITGFTFKSYDKSAGSLQFQIKNQDGSPTDLIDATVRLFMYIYQGEEKKEFPIFDNQIITDSYMQGIVKYPIPDMLLSYEGKVDANVYIDFPDGSHTDNLGFTFNIEKSVIDGDVQLNGEYYLKDFKQLLDGVQQEADEAVAKALEGLDQTVNDAKADVDKFVQEATGTVNQTMEDLNEKLKTTQDQVVKVSQTAETIQTDLATVQGELSEAEKYFVKQETLEKGSMIFKDTMLTTQDWNDITESGIYYCAAATGENMPYSGKLYGFLTVYNELAVIIQKYEFQGAVYMRTFAGNPATWGSWLKFVTSKEMKETLEVEISKAKKDIYSLGEWKILTLASGYKGAEGTTPKYRINTVNGRHNVVFNGAITTTTETLPSQGQQHVIAVLPDELIPTITKMGVGATGLFTTTCRIAVATNGNLYIGNDSGKDVKYCYLDLFQYWLD